MSVDRIPSGTFRSELQEKQKAAIKFSVNLGNTMQMDFPMMGELFRGGKTLEAIASDLNFPEKYGKISEDVFRTALVYALRGYDGEMQFADQPAYEGLLSPEEYKSLAREHVINGVRAQMERCVGIHSQTRADHTAVGKMGAEACGFVLWSDAELARVQELAPRYKTKTGNQYDLAGMARVLNKEFHNGHLVRIGRNVGKKIRILQVQQVA